jgi:dTDP-glucose 4,6-dehydratase
LTGGTGFVGRSFIDRFETFAPPGATVTVLTRDPAGFDSREPALARKPWLRLAQGDVRSVEPQFGLFDGIIHAATPADAPENHGGPNAVIDIIVNGTRKILSLAERCGDIPVLYVSSGAVYGPQPSDVRNLEESYLGTLDHLSIDNAYAQAKRTAELMCAVASVTGGPKIKIARLFSFAGPYLPLDRHFALGNFVRDAIEGGPISVRGDGTAVRSYLSADDMADWLWAIFARGVSRRPYNVGSEHAISIADLASLVARLAPKPSEVEILGRREPERPPHRYVPSTRRSRSELGVRETVALDESIRKTFEYYSKKS